MQLRSTAWGAMAIATVAAADTLVLQELALDHPDGNRNPPPYALRLDGLFSQASDEGTFGGGVGKDTTFSFAACGSSVIVKDPEGDTPDADPSNDFRVEIAGTVIGGQDDADDANSDFGAGPYDIFFEFTVSVVAVSDGWKINPNSASKASWIRSQGNADVAAGSKWFFYDQVDSNNNTLIMQSDNHRNPWRATSPRWARMGHLELRRLLIR